MFLWMATRPFRVIAIQVRAAEFQGFDFHKCVKYMLWRFISIQYKLYRVDDQGGHPVILSWGGKNIAICMFYTATS